MNSVSLNLVAYLIEPRKPKGLFGYQVGSFDEWGNWLPLVIVSSKFKTVGEASVDSERQILATKKALLKRTCLNIEKQAAQRRKSRRMKRDDDGPGAA